MFAPCLPPLCYAVVQLIIAKAGALPLALAVLECGNAPCREAAAWMLSNLACCSEVRILCHMCELVSLAYLTTSPVALAEQ